MLGGCFHYFPKIQKYFKVFFKNPLTKQKFCGIILESSKDGAMERWLSWSKAHDWKSCLG